MVLRRVFLWLLFIYNYDIMCKNYALTYSADSGAEIQSEPFGGLYDHDVVSDSVSDFCCIPVYPVEQIRDKGICILYSAVGLHYPGKLRLLAGQCFRHGGRSPRRKQYPIWAIPIYRS